MKTFFVSFLLLLVTTGVFAAKLPDNGIEPPAVVSGPNDHPINPEPIGNGLAVVAVFGVLYALKKRKKE